MSGSGKTEPLLENNGVPETTKQNLCSWLASVFFPCCIEPQDDTPSVSLSNTPPRDVPTLSIAQRALLSLPPASPFSDADSSPSPDYNLLDRWHIQAVFAKRADSIGSLTASPSKS